jgi:hypothetical protein
MLLTSMASEYRQHDTSDVWHFCSNCSDWPTADFSREPDKPEGRALCSECQNKRDSDNCE